MRRRWPTRDCCAMGEKIGELQPDTYVYTENLLIMGRLKKT
jgi:hypothetical protein